MRSGLGRDDVAQSAERQLAAMRADVEEGQLPLDVWGPCPSRDIAPGLERVDVRVEELTAVGDLAGTRGDEPDAAIGSPRRIPVGRHAIAGQRTIVEGQLLRITGRQIHDVDMVPGCRVGAHRE